MEFYAAQRGWGPSTRQQVISDYVHAGFREGLSLHPLFAESFVSRQLPDSGRVPAMYAYLVSDRRTVRTHPWWSSPVDEELQTLEDVSADHAVQLTFSVGRSSRAMSAKDFRSLAIQALETAHLNPWPASLLSNASVEADVADVLWSLTGDEHPERTIALFSDELEDARITWLVEEPELEAWILLSTASAITGAEARRARSGRLMPALVQQAIERTTGRLLVVQSGNVPRPGAARALLDAATAHRAAPIRFLPDGTLAGVFESEVTSGSETGIVRVLRTHPREDLHVLRSTRSVVTVPGLASPIFAVDRGTDRADLVDVVLDAHADVMPGFEDDGRGAPAPAASELVQQVYDDAGFDLTGWDVQAGVASPQLVWRRPEPHALRWAVKTSAPAGVAGAVWGDAHFARGLASALRRLGHFVVVDPLPAASRQSASLDEVQLIVRGPYRIDPSPTPLLSIEWIISHPDEVTAAELSHFDLVFAASEGWSRRASHRFGRDIGVLLEATDLDHFSPQDVESTPDIVFVGTARGIARPSVIEPLRAGIPVRVYGPDWRGYIPAAAIAADSIPNEQLAARYASAAVVLNDQWPAMKREGFIAMRPFDVVACGGRVISERVEGLEELFGDAVQIYDDPAQLTDMLRRDLDSLFPDRETLARVSHRVREEHSFDARARFLAGVAAQRIDLGDARGA
ncbi:glycosyltransferase [uncultured Microbacterium sp.]|uniref:CgeB family protein n=1 Tax=uncultured Microbacterium sp. TaxID=191216 RepID=UPI0025DE1768|nr:glycosyltransferase [uncultured Microbacterium sp.]